MASHPENKRVLALMPHPDDIEILCAGTLLRLRKLGYEIHVATMTPGDKGSATYSQEEIAGIRRAEAKKAAEILGAISYNCLEFRDLEITFDNPSRARVAELFRQVHPFLVFTTPPADYMIDHEITSMLVRDACFNSGVPNYATGGQSKPVSSVPYLYYSDAIEGHDIFGQPSRVTCIIDISAQMETKAEALCAHDSQRSWLQHQHGMDNYILSMKSWCAKRGSEIGVQFGEAFCQHQGHPHPTNDILSELLGSPDA